ncbi:MAG: hypothetical protein QNJ72_01330 [Pleurocapsa sp. MO_226.B13]|nr:hypothetical protein [Pleurocapsa sp. MO_226.B13]
MNFEEIDRILNRMLEVQQDIQVRQLQNTDAIARLTERQEIISQQQEKISEQQEKNTHAIALLTENIENLNVVSQRHQDRLTNLYSYQQSADTDRLNLLQGLNDIKRKLISIEERLDNAG